MEDEGPVAPGSLGLLLAGTCISTSSRTGNYVLSLAFLPTATLGVWPAHYTFVILLEESKILGHAQLLVGPTSIHLSCSVNERSSSLRIESKTVDELPLAPALMRTGPPILRLVLDARVVVELLSVPLQY